MSRHVVILASGETERRALPNLLRHLRREGVSVGFFADESGLRRHLGKNLGNVDASQPDRIDNPKLHLKNLLAGRLYTAEMAERISLDLDVTTITSKSASFSRFLDVVRNGR